MATAARRPISDATKTRAVKSLLEGTPARTLMKRLRVSDGSIYAWAADKRYGGRPGGLSSVKANGRSAGSPHRSIRRLADAMFHKSRTDANTLRRSVACQGIAKDSLPRIMFAACTLDSSRHFSRRRRGAASSTARVLRDFEQRQR